MGAATALAGCSGGSESVELSNIRVEALVGGVRVIVDYGNGTDENVTAETHVEMQVGEGDGAETYESSQRATLTAKQNSDVRFMFTEEGLGGGIDDRIDVDARATFPDSDRATPEPISCEDCTS